MLMFQIQGAPWGRAARWLSHRVGGVALGWGRGGHKVCRGLGAITPAPALPVKAPSPPPDTNRQVAARLPPPINPATLPSPGEITYPARRETSPCGTSAQGP